MAVASGAGAGYEDVVAGGAAKGECEAAGDGDRPACVDHVAWARIGPITRDYHSKGPSSTTP